MTRQSLSTSFAASLPVNRVASAIVAGIFGVCFGSVFITLGFILTCTVIGAILGIPLMILGLLAMVGGPFAGFALGGPPLPPLPAKG